MMTFEALSGLKHRVGSNSFLPNSMIDSLFDYPAFMGSIKDSILEKGSTLEGKRVAVIGAGASGLIAAYQLLLAGARVDIYEATNRVGGRMYSVPIPDKGFKTKQFELGCMRFPPSSKTLFWLLKSFNINTADNFPDPGSYGTNAELYYQGTRIEWPGPLHPDDPNTQPQSPLFERLGSDFNAILLNLLGDPDDPQKTPEKLYANWQRYEQSGREADKQSTMRCWQELIDRFKDVTFEQAIYTLSQADSKILKKPWTLADLNAFGALGIGSGGFGPLFEIGFLEILRIIANGFEVKQKLVPGGISSLTDALVKEIKNLGGLIYTNRPLKFIRSSTSVIPTVFVKNDIWYVPRDTPGGWQFHVGLTNFKRSEGYDGVIVATTTRAMEVMGLTANDQPSRNDLTQPIKTAIRNLHLTGASKLFVKTKTKFWYNKTSDGKDLPNNIQTDEMLRGLYCLNYDGLDDKGEPIKAGEGVVLISYVWEDDSNKLLGLSKLERYKLFLRTLRDINPEFAQQLDTNVSQKELLSENNMIDWQSMPHYFGACKLNYPAQEDDCQKVFEQFHDLGILKICGDSNSWVGGWIEGAFTSGINAACGIAVALGGKLREGSPLDPSYKGIPRDMYNYKSLHRTDVY